MIRKIDLSELDAFESRSICDLNYLSPAVNLRVWSRGHLIDYYLSSNPFLDAEREEEEILICCEKVFFIKNIIIRKGSQTAFSSTQLEPRTESKGFHFSHSWSELHQELCRVYETRAWLCLCQDSHSSLKTLSAKNIPTQLCNDLRQCRTSVHVSWVFEEHVKWTLEGEK